MAKKHETTRVTPVLLSGGSGTRLWPLSRALYPKQLYSLTGEHSLLQGTALRVADEKIFAAPFVISNDAHRFVITEQLKMVGVHPARLVLEPCERNTAPAVAVAAYLAREQDPDARLLVLPSDHMISDPKSFLAAVAIGETAAMAGSLITFGIAPTSPETGYGYIQRGSALKEAEDCFEVSRFIEKPDADTAEKFLKSGDMYWNSGIFLFRADCYLEELNRLHPEIITATQAAVDGATTDLDFLRLDKEAFETSPSISIDYAIMEHTHAAAVVPVDMGWNDIGSWTALQEIEKGDAQGTVKIGDVITKDVQNAYLRSEGPLVAAIGIKNVIVIATSDAVLVVDRSRVQEVKTLVETLRAEGRSEAESHPKVYRPWGSFDTIDSGEHFCVKRITVKPGKKLSLQRHLHRAEHWVVVDGTALVTRGEESFLLRENESTYIPPDTVHRLENVCDEPLHLIEVQSGSYLGEDDIIRLDDDYGRK